MFLDGPFMAAPFMAFADSGVKWTVTGIATVSLFSTTAWDKTLADTVPAIYLATLEPWALADRS